VHGLAARLQFCFQPSRTDGDIRAVGDRLEKFVGFFDGRRQIGVTKQQHVAFGVQHSVADAVPLAAIPGILQQLHRGIFWHVSADDAGSRIVGAVIDDDDFRIPAVFRGVAEHALERGGNALSLVKGRDNDAVLRRFQGSKNTPGALGFSFFDFLFAKQNGDVGDSGVVCPHALGGFGFHANAVERNIYKLGDALADGYRVWADFRL
jgi:hypothetical protein